MENVEIYRNLTKNCWSVRKRGKIVMHAHALKLSDVSFHVQQSGRERVLRERKKYVHAFVKGDFDAVMNPIDRTRQVTYNPYKKGYFYDKKTGKRIDKAQFAFFDSDGRVYYV